MYVHFDRRSHTHLPSLPLRSPFASPSLPLHSPLAQVTDLHRESIDHLTIPSKQGKGVLRRVEEVFDCWFESGSMPYAQQHYPFENKAKFEGGFPADFIAEGLDQTRGWFYTLTVLSTALFNKPAFKNLIVNGLILASNGKKMSKRLKNYPDPNLVVNSFGADALRLYLINSPVVRAEPFRFQEEGVSMVLRTVMIPWFNAYRFFVQNAFRYSMMHDAAANGVSVNTERTACGCVGACLCVREDRDSDTVR